jgi:hypothetical protein
MAVLKQHELCESKAATAIRHEPPILSQTLDHVPVYTVPSENGYFPTGYKDEILVACPSCQFYQLQNIENQSSESAELPTLLSQGILSLRDPAPGTPDEVVLIGECDGVIFYVTEEDITLTLSQTELTLICVPSLDCLYISLPAATEEHILLHIQGLFVARTNMYDAGKILHEEQIQLIRRDSCTLRDTANLTEMNAHKGSYDDMIPNDKIQQAIYQSSVWIAKQILLLSEAGAKHVEDHGGRLRYSMQPSLDSITSDAETFLTEEGYEIHYGDYNMNIHPKAVQRASYIRAFSKNIYNLAEQVSDSVSGIVGGIIGSAIAEKPSDGKTVRYARQLLHTSVLSYGEIWEGVDKSVDVLTRATKREATACVAARYGDDAAHLCRHTLGATVNFCKTYLTVRRVLNVKRVARLSLKASLKQDALGRSIGPGISPET